jgi:hypothetical protein
LIERFEDEILPFTTKHGSEIGESALQGNLLCEEIIRRQHLFCDGLPEKRPENFKRLIECLKLWEIRRVH